MDTFQSTRPSRGETIKAYMTVYGATISIHSPLAGRDEHKAKRHEMPSDFNPLAPRGARHHDHLQSPLHRRRFQSTRPSRGETPTTHERSVNSYFNPLAPRGARPDDDGCYDPDTEISIHSPLAGRDSTPPRQTRHAARFQSTRPSRGETDSRNIIARTGCEFQSTRPSRGETEVQAKKVELIRISIHSPLAGRDHYSTAPGPGQGTFQSTRPSRGETRTGWAST